MQPREQVGTDDSWTKDAFANRAWKMAALVFAMAIPIGGVTVGAALFVLTAPLMIREARQQGVSPWGNLGAPLIGLVAVSALSALFGEATTDGLLFSLGLFLIGGASLLGGYRVAREPAFLTRVILPALVLSTVFVSCVVLYQYFGMGMRRATGLISYTNRTGTLLMFSGILGLGYLLSLKGWARWSAAPYIALVSIAMSTTLSRAAWIAGLVGAVFLALRRPRRGLAILLITLIVGGALMAFQPAWLARFQSTFNLERNMDRLIMWDAASEIFLDHPILGIGPTAFPLVAPDYVKRDQWETHATPHNIVFSIAAGMGMAGLLALGWLLVRSGRLGLDLWRRADPVSLGVTAAVVALFVNDLFGQGFYTSQVGAVLWFALGMLGGRAEVREE